MLIVVKDKEGIYLSTCMYTSPYLDYYLRPEYRGILNIGTCPITIKPDILLREPLLDSITRGIWNVNDKVKKLCL